MYINRGDVNFFEYGRLIEDEGNGVYSVIVCDPFYDEEDSYAFSSVEVDVNDSWINKEAVERFSGEARDEMDYVLNILSYYGPQEFGNSEQALNQEEVIKILDNWVGEFETAPWHYLD